MGTIHIFEDLAILEEVSITVIGSLGHLFLAVTLAASPQELKSESWASQQGLFALKIPLGWSVQQRTSGYYEDVRLAPKKEPTVSLTILSRRHFRPMTSIDNDQHLRGVLKKYRKKYEDLRVERGPNRVPIGNEESWSYLLLYNTKATDGSKVTVRETVSYLNRRLGDMAYIHHVLIGRVPLPVVFKYSPKIAEIMRKIEFLRAKLERVSGAAASPSPGASPEPLETDEEDQPDESASPSPASSPAPADAGEESAPEKGK